MNTDQTAAEAADQFPDADIVSPRTRNIRIAIIKSSIEKAYCLGVDEMTKAGVEAVSESRLDAYTEGYNKALGEWLRAEDLTAKGFAISREVILQQGKELAESRAAHASEQGADTKRLYYELLLAVGNKYEGETRHETALRYIKEAERRDPSILPVGEYCGAADAALSQRPIK